MAKVVGRDEKAVKRITCLNCASILEYTPSEAVTKRGGDYSGDTWTYKIINCPTCGLFVEI